MTAAPVPPSRAPGYTADHPEIWQRQGPRPMRDGWPQHDDDTALTALANIEQARRPRRHLQVVR